MAGAEPLEDRAQTITFPNGNEALCVEEDRKGGVDAGRLLDRLGVRGRTPMIVVCGGADELVGEELERTEAVLGPAVREAAKACGANVVDGGTAAGVMAIVGAARDRHESAMPVLLGVVPRGQIQRSADTAEPGPELEPHHSHFVFADGSEWGDETQLMFQVAAQMADGARVVVVLAGGGPVAIGETLEAVRRGWPVVVVRRTGGLANTLVRLRRRRFRSRRLAVRRSQPRREAADTDELALRRIVRDGDLRFFDDGNPELLARWLAWELSGDAVLQDAWRTFAGYNRRATALRRSFERFQAAIIGLGIATTAVGLLNSSIGGAALRWAAIVAPSAVALAIALANRRGAGKRWVLLRAAAEAVKVEIYRYRTKTGAYGGNRPAADRRSRGELLANEVKAIDTRLMRTEASSAPVAPADGRLPPDLDGTHDDCISDLDANGYVEHRVMDQLAYYRRRMRRLDRLRGRLQTVALASGAGGTALAAAGAEAWIALTTAISAGAISYLSTLQLDNLIVVYNQSESDLAGIRREWLAKQAADRHADIETLVSSSETVLTSELSGWVQQMHSAIEEQERRIAAERGRPGHGDLDRGNPTPS